ncbi:MAG: hypothetical protein CVT49_04650 [candidate division Zixibacteria bacterium HGW-Zixibacteria-1]|nr:MAG: hypothetical protein CVT49_04650 [candidate division Zixibacteria bacterium HGW-Zixibacteria-1]
MRVISLTLGILALSAMLLFGIGCDREVINEPQDDQVSYSSCFTCHGEDGYILAAQGEWLNSIHASGNNVDYTNRAGRDCAQCHDHQGFLEFLATGSVSAPYENVSAIHCFTCHAPHTRGNLTLRTDDPYALANGVTFDHGAGNLCVNCHHARYNVDDIVDSTEVEERFGPHHGPQGDLLQGTGGYEFAGNAYGNTGHYNVDDNNACIGCHMGNPETHVGYRIGGHSFNMVDEESGATLVGICQGCHPDAVDYDYDDIQTDVLTLLEDLKLLLFDAGILVEDGTPPDTIIGDAILADKDLAGALYNYVLVEEDRSEGVHNPAYIVDLLETSINYMESLAGKVAVGDLKPLTAH